MQAYTKKSTRVIYRHVDGERLILFHVFLPLTFHFPSTKHLKENPQTQNLHKSYLYHKGIGKKLG